MSLADLYTKDYFENQGGSNYREYIDWPFFKERAEWIVKNLKPKKVFEIGCAKGFMINHLIDLGVKTEGVEISKYAVGEAKNSQFIHNTDFIDEPLPDSYYNADLVVSFDVLEHIPKDKIDTAMLVLKQAKKQFHMITTTEYDFGGDHTHFSSYPKQWWLDKFEEYGIKNYTIIHAGEQEEFMV